MWTRAHKHPAPTADRKPKVLVVGAVFRGRRMGGTEMFTEILLNSAWLADRFQILHLDTTRPELGAGKAGTLALVNFGLFLRQYARLLFMLVAYRPDILHQPVTSGISLWKEGAFMLTARLFGARVVGHMHSGRFRTAVDGEDRRLRLLSRRVLRAPHALIALSEGWRAFMLETISPDLNIAVIGNTVAEDFARQALNFERPSPPPIRVLFIGSLHRAKGFFDALRAAELVRRQDDTTQFVFAGESLNDDERAEFEQARAAALASGGVSFPGVVTGAEKVRLFQSAHMVILPSYHENLPIVVLEAMAAGLPLVVTPVGALPEILREGENGWFVEPGDVERLAERILLLVRDGEQRAAMGGANRALFCRDYAQPAILSKIERLYRSLLEGPQRGRERSPLSR